jgi:cysteine-rich repeat protein
MQAAKLPPEEPFMSKLCFSSLALVSVIAAGCLGEGTSQESALGKNGGGGGAALSGGIFTTTIDGARVNANLYAAKGDVYLDGGPGNGAPSKAAALPEGDYYFQVTDPSGKKLLSSDDVECRRFHISADGVIDAVVSSGCGHATGIDQDHEKLGAITVQLMPFADTPNPGGEYKVWVTTIAAYGGGNGHGRAHGFSPSDSKTDNFKVRVETPPGGPVCGNGELEDGEQCDDGNTTDGDGCSATCTHENPPPPHACCGDGTVEAGEQCDDGNTTDGDGCSATCTIEPPPPAACCGNGVREAGEECDDGNLDNHDGCSSTCTIEPPK